MESEITALNIRVCRKVRKAFNTMRSEHEDTQAEFLERMLTTQEAADKADRLIWERGHDVSDEGMDGIDKARQYLIDRFGPEYHGYIRHLLAGGFAAELHKLIRQGGGHGKSRD